MTVPDEIQSFHFNKPQCTIHPLVLYLPSFSQSSLHIQQSMAFFSDDLNHDTSFVFAMQQKLVSYLEQSYPHIEHIEYFSDGCAGQYKNFKNLLNLTSLKGFWAFSKLEFLCYKFHGKSSWEGVM